MQHPDRGTARGGRPALQPVPHHRAVRPDAAGPAHRAQPPLGRHGQHHRDGDLRAREQLGATQHQGSAGDDPQAQRVLDRPVRQVPRGARLAVLPDGTVRRLALGRRRVRDVLRVHRRGEQPVGPRAVRGDDPRRATRDPGGGVPPHRGPRGPRGELDPAAEGADAGQAVLRLLRARRDARPAPRPQGVGRQVRGRLRRRLGRAARTDLRPAEGARGDPRGRRADRPARRDPRVGGHARRAQARAGPPDGGLRGLPRARRPPRGPARRHPRRPRDPRRHARLLHHRRQRRVGRGHPQRGVQRDGELQRHGRPGDARVPASARSTSSAHPAPTTTTPSAGRGR